MAKAKRMKKKEHKIIYISFKYFIIFLFLILIDFFALLYLIKSNKIAFLSELFNNSSISENTNSSLTQYDDSSKNIVGLDDVKILKIESHNSNKMGFIKIYLVNTSDKKITNKTINLLLLDENNSFVYGTSFKLPFINENEEMTYDIISSSEIKPFTDYYLKLENSV